MTTLPVHEDIVYPDQPEFDEDGVLPRDLRTFVIQTSDVERCPIHSLLPSHYRDDGSCLCPPGRQPIEPLSTPEIEAELARLNTEATIHALGADRRHPVGEQSTPRGFAYGQTGSYLGDAAGVLDSPEAVVTVAGETWRGQIDEDGTQGTVRGWVVRDRAGRRLRRSSGRNGKSQMAHFAAGYARAHAETTAPGDLALNNIAALMSGQAWDADTLDSIAAVVRSTGRVIRDVR